MTRLLGWASSQDPSVSAPHPHTPECQNSEWILKAGFGGCKLRCSCLQQASYLINHFPGPCTTLAFLTSPCPFSFFLLGSQGYPRRNSPCASVSQVLGLQVDTIMPGSHCLLISVFSGLFQSEMREKLRVLGIKPGLLSHLSGPTSFQTEPQVLAQ